MYPLILHFKILKYYFKDKILNTFTIAINKKTLYKANGSDELTLK